VPALAIFIPIMAQAQESHPIYDNSPIPGQGSHPAYDAGAAGASHPIYDSTLPPQVGNQTGVGRSINALRAVVSDLEQTPPDPGGAPRQGAQGRQRRAATTRISPPERPINRRGDAAFHYFLP
jgi:hypothetical protein